MSADQITLLHLSDLHATASGTLFETIPVAQYVQDLTAQLPRTAPGLDAVVVTGDLVHRQDAAAYHGVFSALSALREVFDISLHLVPGNHDVSDHPAFSHPACHQHAGIQHAGTQHAGTQHAGTQHAGAQHTGTGLPWSRQLGPLRLIGLDSSTAELGEQQLHRLREILREPAPWGSVLCLHHSPVDSPLKNLAGRGLVDSAALADVVRGSDIRLILTGHYHHVQSGSFAGAGLWTTPALAYQQPTDDPQQLSGEVVDRPMYSIITLTRHSWSAVPLELRRAATISSQTASLQTASSQTARPSATGHHTASS